MKEEQLAKELIQVWCRLMKKPVPQKTETTSRGEYGVLIYLTSVKDGATPGELAAEFDVGSGRVADILKSLTRKRLIERRTDPQDRRRTLVFLTAEGKMLAEEKQHFILAIHMELVQYLGQSDTEELIHLMRRVAEFTDSLTDAANTIK